MPSEASASAALRWLARFMLAREGVQGLWGELGLGCCVWVGCWVASAAPPRDVKLGIRRRLSIEGTCLGDMVEVMVVAEWRVVLVSMISTCLGQEGSETCNVVGNWGWDSCQWIRRPFI